MTRAIPSFWAEELAEIVRGVLANPHLTSHDLDQLGFETSSIAVSMKSEAVRADELSQYQAMLNAMEMLEKGLRSYTPKHLAGDTRELYIRELYIRHVEDALLRLLFYNRHSPMDTFHEDVAYPTSGWRPTGTSVDALSDVSSSDMQRMFTRRGPGWTFVGPHGNWLVNSAGTFPTRILAILDPESQWTAMALIDWLVAQRKDRLGT